MLSPARKLASIWRRVLELYKACREDEEDHGHLQVFGVRHQHSDEGVPHHSHRAGQVTGEEEICVWVEDLPCGLLGNINK